MRSHSDQLPAVLAGSNSRRLLADVFHGADRVMQGLQLTAWELEFDLTATVKMSGTATAVYSSVAGESLVPSGTDGILSPFSARLLLSVEISAGDFVETVTIGWARVTAVTGGFDVYADSPQGPVVSGSQVALEFLSLDENVRRRAFRSPEQPPSLTSVYDELRRITGMTVNESVPDTAIPSSVVYDTTQGGRLQGAQDLFAVLDGVGVIDPAGAWEIIPNTIGDPVMSLVVGADGTVTDVGYSVDTDTVYNCVVGNFEDPDRNPIYSVAEITDGPLATSGDYGENTDDFSSPLITTQAAADLAVKTRLNNSIGGQTYQVPFQCMFNPIIDLGDVASIDGWTKNVHGRCLSYTLSDSSLMNGVLEVPREFT